MQDVSSLLSKAYWTLQCPIVTVDAKVVYGFEDMVNQKSNLFPLVVSSSFGLLFVGETFYQRRASRWLYWLVCMQENNLTLGNNFVPRVYSYCPRGPQSIYNCSAWKNK